MPLTRSAPGGRSSLPTLVPAKPSLVEGFAWALPLQPSLAGESAMAMPTPMQAALLAVLLSAPVLADPAPQPCCSAAIVPAGFFEVEANYSGDGVAGGLTHTSNLTLKYSVTDQVQFQLATNNLFVSGPLLSPRAVDGVSPLFKWVFNQQGEAVPQFAVSLGAVFPTLTTSNALQSTVDSQAMLYVSRDFGPWHFDLNGSLGIADLGGEALAQGGAGFAGTLALSPDWALGSGIYSAFGSADRLLVDGGVWASANWAPTRAVALSVGAEVGLVQDLRSFSVFVGLAFVTGPSAAPVVEARRPLEAVASR